MVIYSMTYVPFTTMLFSDQGFVIPRFVLGVPEWLQWLTDPPTPAVAWTVVAVYMIAVLAFTVGWRTRMAGATVLALGFYFWQLNLHSFTTSYVRLTTLVMIILTIGGSGETLSFDARRRYGTVFGWRPILSFSQRLLAVQLTATYFVVGIQKLVLVDWQRGEILPYSLICFWSTPPAFAIARLNIPMHVWDVLTELVKAFEIMAPFGLWHPPSRKYWIMLGIFFHAAIAALLAIWWFVFLYPVYVLFYPPGTVHGYLMRKFPGRVPARPSAIK